MSHSRSSSGIDFSSIDIGKVDFSRIPIKEGYLAKEGGMYKSWKVRYFVLYENVIFYFESHQTFKKEADPYGKIILDGAKVDAVKLKDPLVHPFAIYDQTSDRVFILDSPTEKERKEWVIALSKVLTELDKTESK